MDKLLLHRYSPRDHRLYAPTAPRGYSRVARCVALVIRTTWIDCWQSLHLITYLRCNPNKPAELTAPFFSSGRVSCSHLRKTPNPTCSE